MDALVFVKEIIDTDVWIEIDPVSLQPDPEDLVFEANPCDLAAVGMAVNLIRAQGSGSVTALLLGPRRSGKILRRCLDYGVDRVIHLMYENMEDVESHQVAEILSQSVRRLELTHDLVFAGHHGSDGGWATGYTGIQVAAMMGLPHLSKINGITWETESDKLIVTCMEDSGTRTIWKCRPPLALIMHPETRSMDYPSLGVSLEALNKPVEQVDLISLDLEPSRVKRRIHRLGTSLPKPRPRKVFTPDSALSAAERIRLIMDGGLKQKRSEFLEGSPEELAARIVDFLIERKLLSLQGDEAVVKQED
jgi:electron transfer flavoprotein beta subunit